MEKSKTEEQMESLKGYDSWKTTPPDDLGHHPECPEHEDNKPLCECDDSFDEHGPEGCAFCASIFDDEKDICLKYRPVPVSCECDDIAETLRLEQEEERRERYR